MKRPALVLVALLALGFASFVPAGAQTISVVNPRIVEFDPSADHATVSADGQPLVQRYELRIFRLGSPTPYTTTDLGKPAPEADGKIRVDFSTRVSPWPPDGNYEARVAAVGPSGLGLSDASNSFSLVTTPTPPPTCAYALSSQSLSLAAGPGTASIVLTTGSTCGWTAASDSAWLTPASGSGTGPATLSIVVAANATYVPRTASLTIAGQAVRVTQAGAACTYALTPASVAASPYGQSVSIGVAAGGGCAWTASTDASWITLGTTTGTSDGLVSFSVPRNGTKAARTGTVLIGGQACTITQTAPPSPSQPKKPRIVK